MASDAQPTIFTFGVEIETLLRPKQHIVQDLESDFNYNAEDMSQRGKGRNRVAILDALADFITQAGVETNTRYDDDEETAYDTWYVTGDASIQERSNYCKIICPELHNIPI